MRETTGKLSLSPGAAVVVLSCPVACVALLNSGRNDFPRLHTVLDTSIFLLSSILALVFWEIGTRIDRPFPGWLAISFAVSAVFGFRSHPCHDRMDRRTGQYIHQL